MKNMKIILLDVPWDCRYGREVRRGIYGYARPHRPWVFVSTETRRWLRHTKMSGAISMRQPGVYAADARRSDGIAVVGVGAQASRSKFTGLPYVDVNPKAIGEMAVQYFIEMGFHHFGMVAMEMTFHSRYRGEAFIAALRRRKLTCSVFDTKKKYPRCTHAEALPAVGGSSEQIRRWLMGLPKPLAVFCIDDHVGLWVCGACWTTGIRIPEEVAVLGADDDEMFCGMAHPHLSSIQVPDEQVGFEAAKLLDAMLNGKKLPKRPVLLPPMGVVTRQSTDIMAIDDYRVAEAVRFIRENAHKGIHVESVVTETSLPRRTLERRFKSAIGRGPFAEIRRVQIEMVKTLLAQTDKTLEAITPECGFTDVARMSLTFKKAAKMSPGAWRKQFRSR